MSFIPPPNYTQMPNMVLDGMATLGDAELRVVLAIARQTFGWQKNWDRLSIRRLARLAGLTPRNAHKALRGLIGTYVQQVCDGQDFFYRLRIGGDLIVSVSAARASAERRELSTVSRRDTPPVSCRDTELYPYGIQQKKKQNFTHIERKGPRHPSISGKLAGLNSKGDE